MIFIDNQSRDGAYNHALEEYLIKNLKRELFMIWQNDNTVLLGRNQNPYKEVNWDYMNEIGAKLVRRPSGGGCIYTDKNIVQYTIITKKEEDSLRKFTEPVVNYLNEKNVKAEFTGRNDIIVDGRKISGNAQYKDRELMIHHGSIIYQDSSIDIGKLLTPAKLKLAKKSLTSVKSRITSLKSMMNMDIAMFIEELKEYIKNYYHINENYVLSADELEKVEEIRKNKYANDEWTYGRYGKFDKVHSFMNDACVMDIYLKEKNNVIEDIRIDGDYFGEKAKEELENIFLGVKLEKDDLERALSGIDMSEYIEGITKDELAENILKTKLGD
ncbi:hypothetical protein C3V37_05265 [Peptostreptococcaceae bacterium oral taxon 929]|nr:hypothetical protein C3V37_05265 [Peptostreptococcaceae bacterium oral taxon 929]